MALRQHTDTRENLLTTAMSLIWQSNYTNVGVNEICKQAGVTKGCFYHYFDAKADLYYAAVMAYWEQLKQELDEIFYSSYTPLEQLDRVIAGLIEKARNKYSDEPQVVGCPVFTSGAQSGCGENKVNQAAREMSENIIAYNVMLVERLKAGGLLNGDPDPHQLGRMLFQYLQGVLMYGRVYDDINRIKADLRYGVYRLLALKAD